MDARRRKEINDFADRLRDALDLRVPVDVELAVERLGGKIAYDETLTYEAMIAKKGETFEIRLSETPVTEARKKFSIAHELGHLFIHMGYIISREKWERISDYKDSAMYRYGHTEEEFEANEFAAALLMPAEMFRNVAEQHYDYGAFSIPGIAERFGVSREAAINRGRWLGIFSWN